MHTLDQISNHLEFLGYKIEKIEPQESKDKIYIIAAHPKRNNLIFFEMAPQFILFQITLTCQANYSSEMADYINKVNPLLNIAKVFYLSTEDGVSKVRFEGIYVGCYTKELFGQFYDFLETDQQRFSTLDNFDSIFLK